MDMHQRAGMMFDAVCRHASINSEYEDVLGLESIILAEAQASEGM